MQTHLQGDLPNTYTAGNLTVKLLRRLMHPWQCGTSVTGLEISAFTGTGDNLAKHWQHKAPAYRFTYSRQVLMLPLLEFFDQIWVRKALSATGHTVLIYDYLLTFNDEILYIWNAPWTVVKVLFLINRYGNIAGQTLIRLEEAGILAHNSQFFCQRFSIITSYFMFISSESIHILVLIRAWAIWGAQRGMSNILIGSYVSYVLILLGVSSYGAHHDSSEEYLYLDLVKICVSAMPKLMWLCYVGSFILDAITFVLTARSLRRYSREFQGLYPSNLLLLLVRDATIFFVVSV
ncbi:hypothetical protein F4604DRAFT_1764894 [Suillus subluteus]|nr:hypothetical protein F4604DRAFT_1764894 [Suillus subluteus]